MFPFTRQPRQVKSSPHVQRQQRARRHPCRLHLECLEDRTLPSITLVGNPNWAPEGPSPITNAANTIGPTPATTFQVGAVNGLGVDPMNAKHVFAATVNGGIWQTTDFTAATPMWTTTTDLLPSLATTTVAVSPVNSGGLPQTEVIYAGTGSYSSAGGSWNSAGEGG